jgi:hypothetical protein
MASSLKKLTGMGGDVRKIARLLQSKAPAGHMLAYINDEEAALLKARGGKGTPHADTGIPSYELDDNLALQGDSFGGPSEVEPTPEVYGGDRYSGDYVAPMYDFGTAPEVMDMQLTPTRYFGSSGDIATDRSLSSFPQIREAPVSPDSRRLQELGARQLEQVVGEKEKSFVDKLSEKTGLSTDTLARLGIAGLAGIAGSRQAAAAGKAGQAGAQQMQNIAAPYQQAGAQIQAHAQRGELTPQARQSLQAVQAQAAQGAERRGGVGAQQAAAQVEAFRQQLLQQQYDYGLKLSGIGDNIALGAIKTGLEADRYVNQLTNQYYGNIARIAFGGTSTEPRAGGR